MSTVSGQGSSSVVRQPPGDLRLTNWPLVDDAVRAWPTIAGAFAISTFAGYCSHSIAMGLICFGVLNAAVWRLWIPVGFEFGPKGILQTVLWRRKLIPWPNIVRYEISQKGVLLLPHEDRTPLAPLRGLYIRWRDHRDQLVELVKYYVIHRSLR
jgi:hypothetical protein